MCLWFFASENRKIERIESFAWLNYRQMFDSFSCRISTEMFFLLLLLLVICLLFALKWSHAPHICGRACICISRMAPNFILSFYQRKSQTHVLLHIISFTRNKEKRYIKMSVLVANMQRKNDNEDVDRIEKEKTNWAPRVSRWAYCETLTRFIIFLLTSLTTPNE